MQGSQSLRLAHTSPEVALQPFLPEDPRHDWSHDEFVDHRGNHKEAVNGKWTYVSHTEERGGEGRRGEGRKGEGEEGGRGGGGKGKGREGGRGHPYMCI